MTLVAIAGCRRETGGDPTDLYPDPDAGPLERALATRDAGVDLVAWDDPAVDWSRYGAVITSSTWDSVDRPVEYLAWVEAVAKTTVLATSAELVRWNLDKAYLRELAATGLPTIPTLWLPPGTALRAPDWEQVVVKPAISAGGRETATYAASDPALAAHLDRLHAQGRVAMLQPYLVGIDTVGEVDLTFVDGCLTHAVGKHPGLAQGRGVVDRPWEHMSWSGIVPPDAAQREVAAAVLAAVTGQFGVPAYARVDLVPDLEGEPVIIEVEMIDPYLALDLAPTAADRLADTLLALARR